MNSPVRSPEGSHRALGFASFRLYADVRLGICGSKALALVRLERQCARTFPLLLAAYRDGRIGWLAATTLLPVMNGEYEQEWMTTITASSSIWGRSA